MNRPECQGGRHSCSQPATICHHVRLGGGYGQPTTGLAFYYFCSKCDPGADSFNTDMAKHAGSHRVKAPKPEPRWFPVRLGPGGRVVGRLRPSRDLGTAVNAAHRWWQRWLDSGSKGPAHEWQPFAVVFGGASRVNVELNIVTFAPGRLGPGRPEIMRVYWPGSDQ